MKIAIKAKDRTSGYEELFGHGCDIPEEMEHYVNSLDPNGHSLKLVEDDFDFGGVIKDQPPVVVITVGDENPVTMDDGKFRTLSGRVIEDPEEQRRYTNLVREVLDKLKQKDG